jgi:transposase InsO family protein
MGVRLRDAGTVSDANRVGIPARRMEGTHGGHLGADVSRVWTGSSHTDLSGGGSQRHPEPIALAWTKSGGCASPLRTQRVGAGPSVGWAYLVSVIDCCTREIVGWDLSLRCRSEEALAVLNRAVLEILPFGSRGMGLTLTTDNGTQFTSARYVETLNQLGITHRRTAYNHPEGNSYIERFHRSLKEEEVWLNEYQNFDQAKGSIARWIEEYNHDRPHRGLRGRTPHESRAQFLAHSLTSNMAPCV